MWDQELDQRDLLGSIDAPEALVPGRGRALPRTTGQIPTPRRTPGPATPRAEPAGPPRVGEPRDPVDAATAVDAYVLGLHGIEPDAGATHAHAARGVAGAGGALPHRDAIQASFGHHDVGAIPARIGGAAAEAAAAIGAAAYATDGAVAFASAPDLFEAAHEAAHVVQQRTGARPPGGVGRAGDVHEQHADAVAARVVRGESAVDLLDGVAGGDRGGPVVQRRPAARAPLPAPALGTAEPLDALLVALRLATIPELRATAEAITDGMRHRAPADAVYQVPIAGQDHLVRGADLRALDDAAARRSHLPEDVVEGGQDWGRYQLPETLSDPPPDAITAVAANDDLGLHLQVIHALWETVVPGARLRPFFTRTLTDALRGYQQAHGLAATGVVDPATIAALGLGARLGLHQLIVSWPGLDEAALAALVAALGAPPGSARRMADRQHRVALDHGFLAAACQWQIWHLRGTGRTPSGRLSDEDLARLTAPSGDDADPDPDEVPAIAPATAPAAAPTLPAPRYQQIRGWRGQLHELVSERPPRRHRRRRGDDDAPVEPTGPSVEDRLTRLITDAVIPGMRDVPGWNPAMATQREEPARAWGNRLIGMMAEILGEVDHSPERAATAELRARGFTLDEQPLVREGWDPRVGADPVAVAAHAAQVGGVISERRGLARQLLGRLQAAYGGNRPGHLPTDPAVSAALVAPLQAALARIAAHRDDLQDSIVGVRPGRDFDFTLPAAPDATVTDLRQLDRVASTWLTRLQGLEQHQLARAERATAGYAQGYRHVNQEAIRVDLNRAGVEITNNQGNALHLAAMHLDPVFALRVADFLGRLAGLGVTRMWTSGFLRSAMSPADTHPQGMAVDITGFTFSDGTIIHLRSGLPRQRAATAPAAAVDDGRRRTGADEPDAGDIGHGHSDWFDHDHWFGDRTHAHVMMGIAGLMDGMFDRIIGPGHNAQHMRHFHVELSPGGPGRIRLRAISSESTHVPDWVRDGADARDPSWDDAAPRVPVDTGEAAPPGDAAEPATDSGDGGDE